MIMNSLNGTVRGPLRQNKFLMMLTREETAPVIPPSIIFAVPISPNMVHCVSRIDFLVFKKPVATMSMAPANDIAFPIIIVFILAMFQIKKPDQVCVKQ